VTFRLLELLFDQPPTLDAELAPLLSAASLARADFISQLGEIDPAAVASALGHYSNPALGELTLSLQDGTLVFGVGEHHSSLRPRVDAEGEVIDYILVDPPLTAFPPPLWVTLPQGGDGAARVELTVAADPGHDDAVYTFEAVTVP
jgi:hypothetical protein